MLDTIEPRRLVVWVNYDEYILEHFMNDESVYTVYLVWKSFWNCLLVSYGNRSKIKQEIVYQCSLFLILYHNLRD